MKSIPLTRARYLFPVLGLLEEAGVRPGPLLRAVHLPHDPPRADTLLPTSVVSNFRAAAARKLGLPCISLELLGRSSFDDLGDLGRAARDARTLQAGLRTFSRFVRAESSNIAIDLRREGDLVWVRSFDRAPTPDGQWHAELHVAGWLLKLVALARPGWEPSRIQFCSKRTGDREQAREPLGCERIEFGCPAMGFPIPAALLSSSVLPERKADRSALERLRREATPESLSETILHLFNDPGLTGVLSLQQLAAMIDLPERTLQRRLALEGSSYSALTREARLACATMLLSDTQTTIRGIATRLGFSSPSNFVRAFKSWAGSTPGHYRSQHRRGTPSGDPSPGGAN